MLKTSLSIYDSSNNEDKLFKKLTQQNQNWLCNIISLKETLITEKLKTVCHNCEEKGSFHHKKYNRFKN